jgi:hypothetical protein
MFVLATSWSKAMSMSCLFREASSIRIRVVDEIPFMLIVATL